jgi:hypothetical protein
MIVQLKKTTKNNMFLLYQVSEKKLPRTTEVFTLAIFRPDQKFSNHIPLLKISGISFNNDVVLILKHNL